MEIKQLQLEIIQTVTQVKDPEILNTVLKVLQMSENQEVYNAIEPLSSNNPFLDNKPPLLDAATHEIQQSINDVFNT